MKHTKLFAIFFIFSVILANQGVLASVVVQNKEHELELIFSGKFKPEFFYGKNVSWLNDNVDWDRVIYVRHILDLMFDVVQGKGHYDVPIAEFMLVARNRSIWGNPNSIASTTDSEVKLRDTFVGGHKHFVPRHFFWLREGWLRILLNEIIGLSLTHEHTLTFGAFPFELGRGITLGSAYAVGPGNLGFYSDAIVDQYAFGSKLSGELIDDVLSYDFYVALLQNKSDATSSTSEKVLGQEFGQRDYPERGFGKVDFVTAGHLNWHTFNNSDLGHLSFEPYWMFNYAPEQRVEFLGDASSNLGSLGLACEYLGDRFEFGFDSAMNFGAQKVKGWDRNHTEVQNRNGRLVFVNSHVFLNADPLASDAPSSLDPYKAPMVSLSVDESLSTNYEGEIEKKGEVTEVGKNAQKIITSSSQGEFHDGRLIGIVTGLTDLSIAPEPVQSDVGRDRLYNSATRFRDPYVNKYKGWMFVADAAYWFYKKELQAAATVGIATGDQNPNEETRDGDYAGFISLQELYSGKRVRSAYVLGANRLKRPLAQPLFAQAPKAFPIEVRGFTNVIFTGFGLKWTPQDWERKFIFNPNVLAFWQETPNKKFDLTTKKDGKALASTFLGVEANLFMNYQLLHNLECFFVGSLFIPGTHFDDIRGRPLNEDQKKALDRCSVICSSRSVIPNIGTDTAFTLNFGLEYKF